MPARHPTATPNARPAAPFPRGSGGAAHGGLGRRVRTLA